jgi:hypothetical protein
MSGGDVSKKRVRDGASSDHPPTKLQRPPSAFAGNQSKKGATTTLSKNNNKEQAQWNFVVDYNDHFETPLVAYQDLLPALLTFAKHINKEPSELIIYDPYWCQGEMVQLLNQLGFKNVINRNVDFYADIAKKAVPSKPIESRY